jgi:hypothetical protein
VAGAAAVEDPVDSAGAVKTDKRWSELIARMAAARGYEPTLPDGFDADLRDCQVQGFTWLARLSRLGLGERADPSGSRQGLNPSALGVSRAGWLTMRQAFSTHSQTQRRVSRGSIISSS